MSSALRNLRLLDTFRDSHWGIAAHGWAGDETCGCFRVPSPIDKADLRIIVSAGGDWDHVSVSRANRCPNWAEMDHVKRLFFRDDATVMQLHVPIAEHLSAHPYCLHLWRPQKHEIPRPPGIFVAPPLEAA